MSNKKCKTETSVANLIKPKKNYLYECHCMRCCGKKVDPRTQEKHTTEKCLWKSEDNRKNQKNTIMARKKKSTNFISNINPSQTNSNKLTKQKRDDADSFQKNNEDILPDFFLDSVTDFFQSNKVHIHCFHQTFVFQHLIMVTITLIKSVISIIFIKKKRVRRIIV